MSSIKEMGLFETANEVNDLDWAGTSGYAYLIGSLFHAASAGARSSDKACEEMLETIAFAKQGLENMKQELKKKAA